jgi:chromosome segregation protein
VPEDRLRIKSLELNGFKSFGDKTVLRFEPGITAVVGPNGCGKSNVVDAMRWSMGEQAPRRLRGKSMEDVIFGGSEGRSAVGLAEVTLTLDNSDGAGPAEFASYSEIRIARRLYRSGESEYLINGTACRLRDVQDFFRDTGIGTKGYTIVEQGRIAEIVSARPDERRVIIEEAAGIGKYKARRREAESKIQSTEQNLLRVNDVLAEIRRQIGSIERQARKAARYKRFRESLRVLDLSLAADDHADLLAAIEDAERKLRALRDESTRLESRLAERELAIQERRLELSECERVLSRGNEGLLALRTDIKHHESRIDFGRRERESLAETIAARTQELEGLGQQLRSHEAEALETGDELRAVEHAVESEQEVLANAEAEARGGRERLRALEAEREVANAAVVERLTAIARAEDRLAAIDDHAAQLDARLRSTDAELEVGQSEATRAGTEQRALEEGLRNLLAERDRLMGLVREALDADERATARERGATTRLAELRERRETRRARLASLREVVERREDVGAGTRHLLGRDEEERRALGVRGLLRDVLEADRDVETAVEAVLAERAEAIVVDRAEGAVSALERLRSARAGRGIFVSLPPPQPEALGIVPLGQPLLERVRPRPGYEGLARALLGGVNLVEGLREVIEVYGAGRLPATFVTLQGDVLAPDGTVRGGDRASGEPAAAGLLGRVREIRDLEAEVAALEAAVEAQQAEQEQAAAARAQASDELENLRNRHHTAALAVANHEKDLERTQERVKTLGESQEGRVAQRSAWLAERDALGEERSRLGDQLEHARVDRGARQREVEELGLRSGSATRELSRLETIATERRVEHAGRAEKRDRLRVAIERVTAAARETREWIGRREREIAAAESRREELAGSIRDSEAVLAKLLEQEEQARASNDAKREAYERVAASLSELDEAARGLRGEVAASRERIGAAELAVRETELRLGHLGDSIREKWEVDLATWVPPRLEPESPGEPVEPPEPEVAGAPGAAAERDAADAEDGEGAAVDATREARANAELARLPREERAARLTELRDKLQSLGEVNLGAIEEHEELNERFRFLSEQKADLDGTLASLRDAIARINRTSRKRFRETFEAVSKRFSENFPRLFRGGRASLSLTESEDVLEAGIDIMAMPPGKRLQNVNLLSGGEKTLTALALLVAVFQVRPSPFFLLDEVDAALDDVNVERFNEMVRELADDSQFVVITHNKRTIQVADCLYGVTMEQKGISKLVSVHLH